MTAACCGFPGEGDHVVDVHCLRAKSCSSDGEERDGRQHGSQTFRKKVETGRHVACGDPIE